MKVEDHGGSSAPEQRGLGVEVVEMANGVQKTQIQWGRRGSVACILYAVQWPLDMTGGSFFAAGLEGGGVAMESSARIAVQSKIQQRHQKNRALI